MWSYIMRCEFIYCIYNSDYACTISEIHIDHTGMCDTCVLIGLKSDFLEAEKSDSDGNLTSVGVNMPQRV